MRKINVKKIISGCLIILVFLVTGWLIWVLYDLPDATDLPAQGASPSIRIEDRNGQLLYEILSDEEVRHKDVALTEMPLAVQQAVIATEDRNFYENPGIDPGGILRSVWINIRGGETLAGGSTITQQVVRNLLFEPEERYERTMRRKLREALLAWRITRQYGKDEILALYLNQTDFGNLSIGVEAAAQTYFGKSAASLDLAECALLAGLPQSPYLYDPFTHFEDAKQRQQVVLDLMVKAGFISQDESELAAAEQLNLTAYSFPMQAPHFVLMVKGQLMDLLPQETYRQAGGWVVHTTLDLNWQRLAEAAVQNQLERVATDPDAPLGHNLNNAAVVALDPRSGEIMAMVGSPDYEDVAHSGAINMATVARQPGSSLKPLIYAYTLNPNQEQPWTAATMLLDVSTNFTTHDGKAYTPVDYDGLEHGPVLMREALASSLNIPAVLALDHVGLQAFAAFAASLGIEPWQNVSELDLSLALGGGEVSLLDLSAAYGAFANGGLRVQPYAISRVEDNLGNVVYEHPQAAQERVLDERVAWLISDMLSDDEARYLGFGSNSILQLDRPAAVKTGTTTNFHDNWTVGYTPSLVIGVWAGNTSHEGMYDITGLTGAAPIWAQSMRSILSGQPEETFQRPDGMVSENVCTLSGLLPGDSCPYTRREWFIEGTQPTQNDMLVHPVVLDKRSGLLAEETTPPEWQYPTLALDLPASAEAWARNNGLLLLNDLTAGMGQTGGVGNEASLMITEPASGSVYHLAADIPLQSQQIVFSAGGSEVFNGITFYLDGTIYQRVSEIPYQTWWTLQIGNHELWAEALLADGQVLRSETVTFVVK
jgi:penicillin-binding protein 1C